MAITTQRYQGTLTTTAAAIVTSGNVSDVWTVSKALATNTDASNPHTITVYDDNAAAGAAAGNIVYGPVSISPNETKVLPLSALAIMGGGKLWAAASANSAINLSVALSRTSQ